MTVSQEDLTAVVQFTQKLMVDNFYGEVRQKWQNGQIVLIEVEQQIKPKDFIRVDLRITA